MNYEQKIEEIVDFISDSITQIETLIDSMTWEEKMEIYGKLKVMKEINNIILK